MANSVWINQTTPLGLGALTDPGADRILFWDDSAGTLTWLTASTGLSLSGTTLTAVPAGSDTQVQFNDGGAYGGDAGLTYNKTTDTLTVTGATVAGDFVLATTYLTLNNDVVLRKLGNGSLRIGGSPESSFSRLDFGTAGGATTVARLQKKVTGIADNTATDVITVTVPNANHAAAVKVTLLSSNGSTDAFESSRIGEGLVVVARTSGANAVATAATITLTGIATVAAGATHTLAYGVSAISGAAGATNTFTIQVTIDDSGNLGSNQVVVLAEVLNAEATGVTIA